MGGDGVVLMSEDGQSANTVVSTERLFFRIAAVLTVRRAPPDTGRYQDSRSEPTSVSLSRWRTPGNPNYAAHYRYRIALQLRAGPRLFTNLWAPHQQKCSLAALPEADSTQTLSDRANCYDGRHLRASRQTLASEGTVLRKPAPNVTTDGGTSVANSV